jgi:tRNA-binding protein
MHVVHSPESTAADPITFDDFLKIDLRAGTIREALPFPEARNPAYILLIDFGPGIGLRKSIAQITWNHALEDLPDQRVMAVVNFPPRQIGPHRSEVLVLGFPDGNGAIVLAQPAANVPDGARLS